ncbi:protease inhibitor I42 family protein [Nocardioides donggukensis]|uniref:Protease inhibitor I42 family protein n=1 Tax=Nocardioides donggukensis TaxID=2774019 RepID=A0A927K6V9_9ACTN|nr:protease inhibitor I42 family protein [Nocardioides donggukensis]MBD8871026.1 protease inhibitor I42 family protein [Nocardioides donggukensis]
MTLDIGLENGLDIGPEKGPENGLGGVSGAGRDPVPAPRRAVRHHTLDQPSSGRRLELACGDTLELSLRQVGGSGSTWNVAAAPEGIVVERDEHYGPGTHRTGAHSTRLLRFRAVRPGDGLLRLLCARDAFEVDAVLDVHLTVAA